MCVQFLWFYVHFMHIRLLYADTKESIPKHSYLQLCRLTSTAVLLFSRHLQLTIYPLTFTLRYVRDYANNNAHGAWTYVQKLS